MDEPTLEPRASTRSTGDTTITSRGEGHGPRPRASEQRANRELPATPTFTASRALRVSAVGFLNAQPLWHSLVDAERAPKLADGSPMFSVELDLPAVCAERLAKGEVDLALVPVGAWIDHPEGEVVPELGIGCRGAVETVVLVAERPLNELEHVVLDGASRTSVLLLRVLLAEAGFAPTFETVEHGRGAARVSGTTGALVIGDAAFGLPQRFAHHWDLGAEWFRRTGLPFVFAFWAAQPGILEPGHVAALQWAKARSLDKHAEAIASAHRQARLDAGLFAASENHYANYLRRTIRYGLDTHQREGLIEFLSRVRDLKLAEIPGQGDDTDIHVQFAGTGPSEAARAAKLAAGHGVSRRAPLEVEPLLAKAAAGERLDYAEGVFLLEQADVMALGEAADARRAALHPDGVVTYIIDRNVNYTNVCVTRCKFCNFYTPPGGRDAYVLSKDELARKFAETEALGGIQILLQGGLNPELGLAWYEDLFRWTKANFKLALHALSPTEIIHLAHLEELSFREVLERLVAAGMDSLPGGGAEILDDEIRHRISPFKNTADEWIEVMRQAHGLGLKTTATMVFGFQETTEHVLNHLERIRSLQDETGGFTAFITWPFQADGTRLKLRDDTSPFRYLRMQAFARLYLDNVPNLQVSWPTLGPEVGELGLRFGANDFGSVMIEENVVSQAGAHFMLTAEQIEAHVRRAGFTPARRNMRYQRLST